MIPNTTYQTTHYWRNGKVIHELRPVAGGASQFFLIMNINGMQQTPEVAGNSIEEAFSNAEAVEETTLAAVQEQLRGKIVVPNRCNGKGDIPGILIP
jgi:hypothetical protein